MSDYQPSYELPSITPIPLDEMNGSEAGRLVGLTVYVEVSPDSPVENDARVLLRALHHATLSAISEYVVEGRPEGSAFLAAPERPAANPGLLRAVTTEALTPLQKQVASLIGELSDAGIAERLSISERVVKKEMAAIFRRLHVRSRVAAAVTALGLLGTPEEGDKYWAGTTTSSKATPAPVESPPFRPKQPLKPRQKAILRSIFAGGTVNTLALELETNLESMRISIRALARRFDLDENAGAQTLQRYLQENITEFDFLQSEQPE